MNYKEIDRLFGSPLNQVAKDTVQITPGIVVAGVIVLVFAAYGVAKFLELDHEPKPKRSLSATASL